MAFAYILESVKNGSWYYGSTLDPDRRLIEHNSGQSSYTKNKGPWRLIFKREFTNISDALKFEMELKKLKNKVYIKKTYTKYFINK